jgi:hypothetical protein
MALLTVPEYKLWARNEIPTADDDSISDAIAAATQALFNAVGRKIVVAGAASARVFAPFDSGSSMLMIDDCTTVTSVVENGVTVSSVDYQLEPLNGLSAGGESRPYDRIRYKGLRRWFTYYGEATITVTATWGWSAIPAPAIEACKIATKAILDGRDIRLGVLAAVDTGAVTERQALVVRNFVSDYQGHKSWGVG